MKKEITIDYQLYHKELQWQNELGRREGVKLLIEMDPKNNDVLCEILFHYESETRNIFIEKYGFSEIYTKWYKAQNISGPSR